MIEWRAPLSWRHQQTGRQLSALLLTVANKLARIIWAVWRSEQDFRSPLADAAA